MSKSLESGGARYNSPINLSDYLRDCVEEDDSVNLMLVYDKIGINEDIFERSLAFLRINRDVSGLMIKECNLTDENINDVIDIINKCPHINYLDLSNNRITDAGATNLAEFLRTNNTISVFVILDNPTSINGLESFIRIFPNNQTLIALNCGQSCIGLSGCRNDKYVDDNYEQKIDQLQALVDNNILLAQADNSSSLVGESSQSE